MKKLLVALSMCMLMVGGFAANAFGMTMSVENPTLVDPTYNNREFKCGEITITEDKSMELTSGEYFTLALPDGVIWDRDNTKIYRYLDGVRDCELLVGADFKYEDDRKIKFSINSTFGNVESFVIQPVVRFYGFTAPQIEVSLWRTSLGAFSPSSVVVADTKEKDQVKSIIIAGDTSSKLPVLTVGDKKKQLQSVVISESSMNCLKIDDKITVEILTDGVYFDNEYKEGQPYYYPVRWEKTSGDALFTNAKIENSKKASFEVRKNSDTKATELKINLRSISIADTAMPGDIEVAVKCGGKAETMTLGEIVAKTQAQLDAEAAYEEYLATLQPKVGRSIFKIGSLQYQFMGEDYIMTVMPYTRDNVTFIPAKTLATSLGVTDSNFIWNQAGNRMTLKGNGNILVLSVGNKTANFNGVDVQLEKAPEYNGTTVMLPLREIANMFSYNVQWVENTHSVIIDPAVVE